MVEVIQSVNRANLMVQSWLREHAAIKFLLQAFRRLVVELRRSGPLAALAAAMLVIFGVLAVFGPLIAPYDPLEFHYDYVFAPPQGRFLMGTDQFGRDVLSRLIAGTKPVFYVAVSAVVVGTIVGGFMGLVSGYKGGVLDMIAQRIMEAIMAIPILILALALVAMLGPQGKNVILAIAIVNVPVANRVMRGATLNVRNDLYVEAARAIGATDARIVARHILPNVLAPLLVLMSAQFAWAIIVMAALAFLGASEPPPAPSWGQMLSQGARQHAERAPWLAIFPGLFIVAAVFSLNILGDVLRDRLDPRLR